MRASYSRSKISKCRWRMSQFSVAILMTIYFQKKYFSELFFIPCFSNNLWIRMNIIWVVINFMSQMANLWKNCFNMSTGGRHGWVFVENSIELYRFICSKYPHFIPVKLLLTITFCKQVFVEKALKKVLSGASIICYSVCSCLKLIIP